MFAIIAYALAQTAAESPILLGYGPLGVVCLWLMYRDERRGNESRAVGHRIDGLTKALLVDMTERESCGVNTKRYAREEIAKIEARMSKSEPR